MQTVGLLADKLCILLIIWMSFISVIFILFLFLAFARPGHGLLHRCVAHHRLASTSLCCITL